MLHADFDPTVPAVVALRGEIDIATADAISGAVSLALSSGYSSLVLDLSEVTFIDSCGARALLHGRAQLAARGGTLTLRDPGRPVLTVLGLMGVEDMFRIEG